MPYISKITSSGTTCPVSTALYGTCSTAAGTAAKVVTCTDFDTAAANIPVGTTIKVKFTNANSAADPTLNINSKGAITIKRYGTTAPGTNIAGSWNAGAVVSFTYDGTYWVMNDWLNNNDNTYDRNRYNQAIKAWGTALVSGNIIVASSDGLYHHLKQGTAFDTQWPILYLYADVAASATTTNTYDCIPFTITTTQSITLTAYKPVYIKGTLAGTTFTPVSTTPLTQTMTNNDGKYYMLLGVAYSTTGVYLIDDHRIFVCKNNVAYDVASVSSGVEALVENGTAGNTLTRGLAFVPNPSNTGEFNAIRKSNDVRLNITQGSAGGEGTMELVLGNSTAKSGAGNKTGVLSLYSESTAAHEIKGAATSSDVNHTLPAKSGTIYNSGNVSVSTYSIDLSGFTFQKSGGGLYYSTTSFDCSERFTELWSVNIYDFNNVQNKAINVQVNTDTTLWVLVSDPAATANTITLTGNLLVRVVGVRA